MEAKSEVGKTRREIVNRKVKFFPKLKVGDRR